MGVFVFSIKVSCFVFRSSRFCPCFVFFFLYILTRTHFPSTFHAPPFRVPQAKGTDQYCYRAFADALMSIPEALAENSGLKWALIIVIFIIIIAIIIIVITTIISQRKERMSG